MKQCLRCFGTDDRITALQARFASTPHAVIVAAMRAYDYDAENASQALLQAGEVDAQLVASATKSLHAATTAKALRDAITACEQTPGVDEEKIDAAWERFASVEAAGRAAGRLEIAAADGRGLLRALRDAKDSGVESGAMCAATVIGLTAHCDHFSIEEYEGILKLAKEFGAGVSASVLAAATDNLQSKMKVAEEERVNVTLSRLPVAPTLHGMMA